jgi:tetratricopeptide (TPR) repeat protein
MKPLALSLAFSLLLASCGQNAAQLEAEHIKKGDQFAAQKQYRPAAVEYKVAAQNKPSDAEPVYKLGMVYLAAGAGPLAIETLQRALRLNPNHAAAAAQLAMIQVASAHSDVVENARNVLQKFVRNHPRDAAALGSLALAEGKLGHPSEAQTLVIRGLQADPANLQPAAALVAQYAAKGDLPAASAIARAAEEIAANHAEAALLSAQVAAAANDLPRLEERLQHALHMQPAFGPALEMLLRKRLMERNESAASQLAARLSQQPDSRLWPAYGRLLFAQGKIDQGSAEFDRVLRQHPDQPSVRNEYSALLLSAGRKQQAEALVNSSLTADNADKAARLQHAALALDKGDLSRAEADLKTLREAKIVSPALSFQEARLSGARGNPTAQGDSLAEALRLNPRLLAARLELARLLTSSGKARSAIAILDQTTPQEKADPTLQFHRHAALMAAEDWSEARKSVDAALAHSRSPGFLFQDALLRARSADLPGARKSAEQALELAPFDTSALELFGDIVRRQGQPQLYLTTLRDRAAKQPRNSQLQMQLGNECLRQGDRPAARQAYQSALASGAADRAHQALALLDYEAGAIKPARQRLLDRIKIKDSVASRLLLAQFESSNSSTSDAAVVHYLQALKMEPANLIAQNNLANLLVRMGKLDDASFWAAKALAIAPTNPAIADTTGWIHYLRGDYSNALPHLERSLQLMDRPTAHYHLAAVLAKSGAVERARLEFQTGIRQAPNSPERATVAPLFSP